MASTPPIRPAHWSKIKALCVRYARRANDEYESMRPAGDLLAALADALRSFAAEPESWTAEAARRGRRAAELRRASPAR